MSWKSTLKKRRNAVSANSKKLIDEVMSDKVKRTEREILDDMWNVVERERGNEANRKYSIPTTSELRYYLSKNYDSAIYDMINDRVVGKISSPNHKRKWWFR